MFTEKHHAYYENLLKELGAGHYNKASVLPVFIKRDGWVITFHFISIKGDRANLQRLKMFSLKNDFKGAPRYVRWKLEHNKINLKEKLGIDNATIISLKKDNKAQLIKIYQAVANLGERDPAKRRKLKEIDELLSYEGKLYSEAYDINKRYLATLKTYFLTGFWCLSTGVIVEIDERGDMAIRIDENVSLADLKEHWKVINSMREFLIPKSLGQKTYDFLERDTEIYALYKDFIPVKEIAEKKRLSEDYVRKIISQVKKRIHDE